MKPSETRTLLFASIGGALEFYDFVIFRLAPYLEMTGVLRHISLTNFAPSGG
jgi:hypothetical protein